VVDGVEARLDIRVQHLPIAHGAVEVDLGDRVVRPAVGPKPVGDRREVGLEDGFQYQLQRGLNDPITHGRNAQPAQLPTVFGDRPLPHRQRPIRPLPKLVTQALQERCHPHLLDDTADRVTVHTGSAGTAIACDPFPRDLQESRITHQVVQIIETATGIGHRPTVQFGLHLPYPHMRCQAIHPGIFGHCSSLSDEVLLPPFAMWPAFPTSDYYGGSAPSRPDRSTADPAR
jgi:hypothetical protein